MYKPPGIDQIQNGRNLLLTEIYKLVLATRTVEGIHNCTYIQERGKRLTVVIIEENHFY